MRGLGRRLRMREDAVSGTFWGVGLGTAGFGMLRGTVVHPEIIPNRPHHHESAVQSHTEPTFDAIRFTEIGVFERALQG
jgi:hypothetical protein